MGIMTGFGYPGAQAKTFRMLAWGQLHFPPEPNIKRFSGLSIQNKFLGCEVVVTL